MILKDTITKGFELGAQATGRVPVVGAMIQKFFDQNARLDDLITQEGNAEIRQRQAEIHIVRGKDAAEERRLLREKNAKLAAELVMERFVELPEDLRPPIQALIEYAYDEQRPDLETP
jgi:hypothetical protein